MALEDEGDSQYISSVSNNWATPSGNQGPQTVLVITFLILQSPSYIKELISLEVPTEGSMLYVQHGFQECVMLHKPLWTKDRLIHLIIMEEAVGSSNQHWRLQQNSFPLSKRVAKISHEWRNPSTDCSDAT